MAIVQQAVATTLPVMEEFYTIQGEGFNTGKAAYFIRLGGCDVGCHWCDVKESWDASVHPQIEIDALVERAKSFPARMVVVTGGEPLMHNLDRLTERLQLEGFQTLIETSASHPLTGQWDWICVSPKKFKAPEPAVLRHADELKIIVFNKSDFAWAEEYAEKVDEHCRLFLQPEWSKAEEIMPLIVAYVKENPRWRISLQTHKYLNIP